MFNDTDNELARITAVHYALMAEYSISDGNGGFFSTPLQPGPTGVIGARNPGLLMSQEELDDIMFDLTSTYGLDTSMVDYNPDNHPKEFQRQKTAGPARNTRPLRGGFCAGVGSLIGEFDVNGGEGGGQQGQQESGAGQPGYWDGMTEEEVVSELCRVADASNDLTSPEAMVLIPEVDFLGTHPYTKQPEATAAYSKAGATYRSGNNAIPGPPGRASGLPGGQHVQGQVQGYQAYPQYNQGQHGYAQEVGQLGALELADYVFGPVNCGNPQYGAGAYGNLGGGG